MQAAEAAGPENVCMERCAYCVSVHLCSHMHAPACGWVAMGVQGLCETGAWVHCYLLLSLLIIPLHLLHQKLHLNGAENRIAFLSVHALMQACDSHEPDCSWRSNRN